MGADYDRHPPGSPEHYAAQGYSSGRTTAGSRLFSGLAGPSVTWTGPLT